MNVLFKFYYLASFRLPYRRVPVHKKVFDFNKNQIFQLAWYTGCFKGSCFLNAAKQPYGKEYSTVICTTSKYA